MTSIEIKKAIRNGLLFLQSVQRKDGGFDCQASTNPDNFDNSRTHKTPFFTSLILSTLDPSATTKTLCSAGSTFLLKQKNEAWSWNYWQRNCKDYVARAYPDDLDDTACALAAIKIHNPTKLDGTAQAAIAKLLIATEKAPGGPYKTWLVDKSAKIDWQDIDIAVNSNVAFMLSLIDVELPGLTRYIDEKIERGELISRYYLGAVPVIYFISRSYKGALRNRLKKIVVGALKSSEHSKNTLMTAMLIVAGCNLKMDPSNLSSAVSHLLKEQKGGHWIAKALYFEPPIDGMSYFAGSSSLTTAFCVEALRKFSELKKSAQHSDENLREVFIHRAISQISELSNPSVVLAYENFAQEVAKSEQGFQIITMASIISDALNIQIPKDVCFLLNAASLHGWVAYTIYDDFVDDEGSAELVSIANVAHRQMLKNFRQALPQDEEFQKIVHQFLNRMDGANLWEVINTRMKVRNHKIELTNLPTYGDLSHLAERSSGHMLVALAVLAWSKHNQEETIKVESFFHHFLIARQLNDDAHDWWEDLNNGHLSAVVTSLVAKWDKPSINLIKDHERLATLYWEEEVPAIAKKIHFHTSKSRDALKTMSLRLNAQNLEQWLINLDKAADSALRGSRDAKAFMKSFS